jgi:protein-disulfide isomerase
MFARVFATVLAALFVVNVAAESPLNSKNKVVALIFISSECPISNKMVPEIERLYKKFAKKDAGIWIVYPNASDTDKDIKEHRHEYHISTPFVRDPNRELVKKAGITVTPEAVVYNEKREMMYRGRINDQFLALGKGRPQPTQHDLEEAIEAVLAGGKPKMEKTEAVGCYLQDEK